MSIQSKEAQERAEANFRKKELQAREASKAMAEYEAARRAEREKTARLRTLRLAKEAEDAAASHVAGVGRVGATGGKDRSGHGAVHRESVHSKSAGAAARKRPSRARVAARAE